MTILVKIMWITNSSGGLHDLRGFCSAGILSRWTTAKNKISLFHKSAKIILVPIELTSRSKNKGGDMPMAYSPVEKHDLSIDGQY